MEKSFEFLDFERHRVEYKEINKYKIVNGCKLVNMQGKVKQVITKVFKDIQPLDIFTKEFDNFQFSLIEKTISKFNETGYLIEESKYENGETLLKKITSDYLKDGCKIEENIFEHGSICKRIISLYNELFNIKEVCLYSLDGKLTRKTSYKYDDKNHIIEKCSINSDDTVIAKDTYTYDSKGNINEIEWLMPDGKKYKYTFKYYKNGEISQFDCNDSKSHLLIYTHFFKYDANGLLNNRQILTIGGYLVNNKTIGKVEIFDYEYNDKGNIIKRKDHDNSLVNEGVNLRFEYDYLYRYDNYGNWKTLTEFCNSVPFKIVSRSIEYY